MFYHCDLALMHRSEAVFYERLLELLSLCSPNKLVRHYGMASMDM
jgi:hypothetical protein